MAVVTNFNNGILSSNNRNVVQCALPTNIQDSYLSRDLGHYTHLTFFDWEIFKKCLNDFGS